MPADAVIIDVEGGGVDLGDAIVIDDSSIESFDHSDFITLADDTVMLSDTDMMDLYSTDMDGADISFIVAVKCPHCHVGLKVDEGKIPLGITSFKCPKCKEPIPLSLLSEKSNHQEVDSDTILVTPVKTGIGRLTVLPDADTPEQAFPLHEGKVVFGRKSNASQATMPIITADRTMSREHICIEVKKDSKGGYKHFLTDNNSKNHTLYNNSYLENGEVVVLNDNDEIIIGRTVLRFNE